MVFGEVADVYERVRPGYPAELVDDVLAFASVWPGDRVLEVGAGTGKATRLFAAHGVRMVCLEPNPAMAAVARRSCALFPDVSIQITSFEDWPVEPEAFSLLISAQAWHWVSAEVRCPKAHAALRPAGAIALFWNRPRLACPELREAFDKVYEQFAPGLMIRAPGGGLQPSIDDEELSQVKSSELFLSVSERCYAWSEDYPTVRYLDLLETQSDHRLLDDDDRARLLDCLGSVIASAGGVVTLDYDTRLYLARRA